KPRLRSRSGSSRRSRSCHKRRKIAVQVQQSMHLQRCLVLTKLGPAEERNAEVNGGRVQSVQTFLQLPSDGIMSIQRACDRDQSLRKVRIDAPVPRLIGSREDFLRADYRVVLAWDKTG